MHHPTSTPCGALDTSPGSVRTQRRSVVQALTATVARSEGMTHDESLRRVGCQGLSSRLWPPRPGCGAGVGVALRVLRLASSSGGCTSVDPGPIFVVPETDLRRGLLLLPRRARVHLRATSADPAIHEGRPRQRVPFQCVRRHAEWRSSTIRRDRLRRGDLPVDPHPGRHGQPRPEQPEAASVEMSKRLHDGAALHAPQQHRPPPRVSSPERHAP